MTAAKRTVPISSHPAFKWGVGAWFALLLGLGLFVMPAQVHLLFAERLGLGGVTSDAATIRLVLSLAAALLGFLIGLVLAMRVVALSDAAADIDEIEPEDEGPNEEPDNVWLPDADHRESAPSETGRTHPLRHSSPPAPEPEEQPRRVDDAPRRPFNPREDLAEEGIASFFADPDPIATEAEDIPEGLTGDFVLTAGETVPEVAYFDEAWDSPLDETAATDDDAEPAPEPEPAAWEPDEDFTVAPAAEDGGDATPSAAAPAATAQETATAPLPTAALGDLSLEALTERLARALETAKSGPPEGDNRADDPVIAFLRREAERDAPASGSGPRSGDPQAELRSALDKLSRVGKHR